MNKNLEWDGQVTHTSNKDLVMAEAWTEMWDVTCVTVSLVGIWEVAETYVRQGGAFHKLT